MTKSLTYTRKKSRLGCPALLFLFLACIGTEPNISGQELTTQSSVISKMAELNKKGRYGESAQLGINALQNKPSDQAVLEQIAIVYLIRAEKEPVNTREWIKKAVQFEEKALSIKPTNIAALYTGARSYEGAADLSTSSDQCAYYRRAKEILQQRSSMLRGNEISVDGKHFPIEPLRNENAKISDRVKTKMLHLECK